MKLTIFFLSTFVAVIAGAPSEIESRILGGATVIDPKAAYYIVAITVNGEHVCSGFIYNLDWIVTAASCVSGATPANTIITVGMTSQLAPNANQKDLTVASITIHPNYNPATKLNDIALIKTTAGQMVFSDYVYLKYYDEEESATTPPALVDIMGWGATTEGGLASLRLRKATLEITDTCKNSYGNSYYNNYMLCAGNPTTPDPAGPAVVSPCQYDEGSPLVQLQAGGDGVVIGIMSRNVGCGSTAGSAPPPTIFTRLASYFSWLRTTAGVQPRPTAAPGR